MSRPAGRDDLVASACEHMFARAPVVDPPDRRGHTTFRFALAPTSGQAAVLARHAGASRFAYNQSLRLVMDALAARQTDPSATVPWSGFDLINAFNAWKRGERAGRRFAVSSDGTMTKQVTGLPWRHQVCAQVFEEAAVDLGRALTAHAEGGNRQVGFPKPKRKGRCRDSFRLRNKKNWDGDDLIRLGEGHPRSVTLPKIGIIRVHDDTRRLRRLLRSVEQLDPTTGKRMVVPRARILFANVIRQGDRWYVCLNVRAPDSIPNGVTRLGWWVSMEASSGSIVAWPYSRSPPLPMASRPLAFMRPSRSPRGWDGCGGARGPFPVPIGVLATGPPPLDDSLGSTLASPTSAVAFCTRSQASSPRPTAGWLSRTLPSPISSATAI
jgi:Helix-turn-helix domain